MKTKLYSVELSLYFFVWILANLFTLYKLFEAQSDILEKQEYYLSDLQPGWSFVSRLKDVSDVEWSSWKYFIQLSWSYLIIQFIVTEIVRRTKITNVKHWYIISSMIFVVLHMGIKQLIIILTQPLLYAAIILCGGKKISIWITSVTLLISYNTLKYKYIFWALLDHEDLKDEEVYLILFCVAWVELRCISFSIDYIDAFKDTSCTKNRVIKNNNTSYREIIINMLSYVLYVPLLFTGPVILYEDFEQSFCKNNEKLSVRLRRFIWDMTLFQIYTFALDLSHHYIYFSAMQSNIQSIRELPTLALCGSGLWMGFEFHIKYVIGYGIASAFARLDHVTPPPTPRCIARIHVYSQMWRYFDVGLYRFLVRYIYKPTFDVFSTQYSLSKTTCKFAASLCTFLFIFMWHGTIRRILIWSVLNYIGITLEHLSKAISKSETYRWFKEKILKTDSMETRFIALSCVPLLALSAVSNFYLLGGAEVGDLFFESFTHPSFWNSLVVCMSLYCCCQVSIALEDVPSRTDVKRKE